MGLTQITTGGVDDNINIDSNTLKVDGTNNRVGIGTSSPNSLLDCAGGNITLTENTNLIFKNSARDTNRGAIQFTSGGEFRIRYGALLTEALRIDSSGNLGVGTTSPTARLDVRRGDTDGLIAELHQSTGYGIDIGSSESVAYISSGYTQSLAFKTDPGSGQTERARIDSAGRVGVGLTSPQELLHIHTTSAGANLLQFSTNTSGSTSADGGVIGLSSSNKLYFYNREAGSIQFGTSNSARATIDSSGRLLVGTTSAPLDDAGALIQESAASGCSFVMHRNDTTVVNDDSLGLIRFYSNAGSSNQEHARISGLCDGTAGANDKPGKLVFYTTADGASSPTERMRVDSSGNVGIGVTSVDSPLHVYKQSSDRTARFQRISTQYIDVIQTSGVNRIESTGKTFDIGTSDSNNLIFRTANSERMRLASGGRLLINQNTSSPSASNIGAVLQVNEGSGVAMSINRNSGADAFAANLCFRKTRSSAADGTTLVANGDALGTVQFMGTDGDQALTGAQIQAAVDGTPSNDVMPSRLMFFTNGGGTNTSERMRIDNSGAVLIRRTSNTDGGVLTVDQDASSNNVGISTITTSTGTRYHLLFRNGNGQVGSIATNGSSTAFNTSSDYRLKENVVDLDGAIDRVKQLAPKRFNFIADADTTVDGFLAHEAQTVVPEAVTGTHNEVDDDDNPVYQSIDQSKLVPLLTAALQEAIAKIETLETKVAALEAE